MRLVGPAVGCRLPGWIEIEKTISIPLHEVLQQKPSSATRIPSFFESWLGSYQERGNQPFSMKNRPIQRGIAEVVSIFSVHQGRVPSTGPGEPNGNRKQSHPALAGMDRMARLEYRPRPGQPVDLAGRGIYVPTVIAIFGSNKSVTSAGTTAWINGETPVSCGPGHRPRSIPRRTGVSDR